MRLSTICGMGLAMLVLNLTGCGTMGPPTTYAEAEDDPPVKAAVADRLTNFLDK